MKKILALFVVVMMSVLAACSGKMGNENRVVDMPVAEEQRETYDNVAKEKELPDAEIGETIEFGRYEQDNDNANGKEPIKWRILAQDDSEMLIISEKGLDSKSYNEEYVQITWETCTLRAWLNGEFYNEAFTDEEKRQIKKVTIVNEDGGNDTEDKVFLLNLSEVEKYFSSKEDRICKTTDYAMKNSTDYRNKGALPCCWWLRTPGGALRKVAIVLNDGNIDTYGGDVYRDQITTYGGPADIVRPAMWIEK